MSMFTLNSEKQAQSEQGGGGITTSGIYDVTLRAVEIKGTVNGATQANYFFDKAMSYGNNIVGTDGAQLFGADILKSLGYISGMGDGDVIADPEEMTIQFKTGAKDLMCLPDFVDMPVKVWLKFKYSRYKGEIKESIQVGRFYRATDGASSSEIIAGEGFGTRLEKDKPFAEKVTYEDGVTADEVAAWKQAQRDKSKAAAPAGGTAAKPATANPFGGAKA